MPSQAELAHLSGAALDATAGPAKVVVDLGFSGINPGPHTRTGVRIGFATSSIQRTDLLERPLATEHAGADVDLRHPLCLAPFEIVSLRIQRG